MLEYRDLEAAMIAGETTPFFSAFFSPCRFGIETFLALFSIALNMLALTLLCRTRNFSQGKSVYRAQYANLTVVNAFSCLFSWFCNNLLYLFRKPILRSILLHVTGANSGLCRMLLCMLAGSFISSAFGILNTMCMLGFATTQYFAICRPLQHMDLVRRKRVIAFIFCAWVFSLLCGFVPFGVSLAFIDHQNCTDALSQRISTVAILGCNISICFMTVMYILTIILCVRIYVEVRFLQTRLSQFRFMQNVQGERKVFITTVILLCTLSVFFLPYTVVYILTLNMSETEILQHNGIIYYMNFLPYFKFISDPLVYGARMRDMQYGCKQMFLCCCREKCVGCASDSTIQPPTRTSSIRIPLRNVRSFSLTTL